MESSVGHKNGNTFIGTTEQQWIKKKKGKQQNVYVNISMNRASAVLLSECQKQWFA